MSGQDLVQEFANGDRLYDLACGCAVAYKASDGHHHTLREPGGGCGGASRKGRPNEREGMDVGLTKHGSGEILPDPQPAPPPEPEPEPARDEDDGRQQR